MYVMRYTVITKEGTVSFVAPCSALKALVAACSKAPATLDELLSASTRYDKDLQDYLVNSLAIFDEHNAIDNTEHIHSAILYADEQKSRHDLPAFRVVDDVTRQASLQPVKAGLVLFNLKERRIVQVQNTYANIERRDRGRIHEGGVPTDRIYHYNLPNDWRIVP